MSSYDDYWARAQDLNADDQEYLAERLLDEMLAAHYDSLSNRDYIEFFNIIGMIHDSYPVIIKRYAPRLVAKMLEDHRLKHRQDQVYKAQLIYEMGPLMHPEKLIFLIQDLQQDLDTRNAAVKLLWRNQSIETAEAVEAVKEFIKELQGRYLQGDTDSTSTFAMDSATCLYKLRSQDPTVLYLLWQIYRLCCRNCFRIYNLTFSSVSPLRESYS